MAAEAFVALLVIVTLPVTGPTAAGAKLTVNVVRCPGFNMTPFETPVALNPRPETPAPENVIAAVPVLDSVNICDVVAPILMLPKAKLV